MSRKGMRDIPEIQTLSMDFMLIGTDEVEGKDDGILVMYDKASEATWAYRVGKKREPAWLTDATIDDLTEAGCSSCRICTRSDGEKSIQNVEKSIIQARDGPTAPQ